MINVYNYNKYYFSSNLVYCLYPSGLWSTPSTTGKAPPPCSDFSFVKVSDSTVVLYEGSTDDGYTNDLYKLDINIMVSACELCKYKTYYLADVFFISDVIE